ncbi:MAG: acyl carrier protein [Lactobacillus sp.]|nr:acyl carrier protein [Lactobacillus sp.]
MTETEIFEKIKKLLAENFDVKADEITMDTNFKNDLNADSIDLVEFIMNMEDEFGNEIADEDAEKLHTVKDAVAYISEHIK